MTSTAVAPTNAAAAATVAGRGTSGTSSAAANSLANNGLASLTSNFQSFLTLLTTQLQNQDPLNPTDTNQFTQQITQMSGVEQQLLSNQLLQQLVSAQGGVTAAANLIGDKITAAETSGTGSAATTSTISGTVTAVSQVNGQTMLTVSSQLIPLTSVTSVTGNSASSLASLLGG